MQHPSFISSLKLFKSLECLQLFLIKFTTQYAWIIDACLRKLQTIFLGKSLKMQEIENVMWNIDLSEKYHGIILDQVVTGLLIQFVFKSLATVSLDN